MDWVGSAATAYFIVTIIWLCAWGWSLEGTAWWLMRRVSAWMMLLCPLWPVLAVGWLFYGVYRLVKIAIGRDD